MEQDDDTTAKLPASGHRVFLDQRGRAREPCRIRWPDGGAEKCVRIERQRARHAATATNAEPDRPGIEFLDQLRQPDIGRDRFVWRVEKSLQVFLGITGDRDALQALVRAAVYGGATVPPSFDTAPTPLLYRVIRGRNPLTFWKYARASSPKRSSNARSSPGRTP